MTSSFLSFDSKVTGLKIKIGIWTLEIVRKKG